MKNLKQYAKVCMNELDALGIPYIKNVDWKVSTRATKWYGRCEQRGSHYTIKISDKLLQDDINDFPLKNTIIHELLHTTCMDDHHGGEWARMAKIVNNNSNYKIARLSNYRPYGVHMNRAEYKYEVYCPDCGVIQRYKRKGNVIKCLDRYICGHCKGKLKYREL